MVIELDLSLTLSNNSTEHIVNTKLDIVPVCKVTKELRNAKDFFFHISLVFMMK